MVCQAWAIQGYGTPWPVYLVYILKIFFYIWVWSFFCSFTEGLGDLSNFKAWYFEPFAFQKAVLWSMVFEELGARLRKRPADRPLQAAVWRRALLRAGRARPRCLSSRGIPDLRRLQAHAASTWHALRSAHRLPVPRPGRARAFGRAHRADARSCFRSSGLTDKAIFLSARAEHYYTALVCLHVPRRLARRLRSGSGSASGCGRRLRSSITTSLRSWP